MSFELLAQKLSYLAAVSASGVDKLPVEGEVEGEGTLIKISHQELGGPGADQGQVEDGQVQEGCFLEMQGS
ncbi:MAG: hypothetical protein C0613_14505 [Desulfobulbaceae bacterium]|nr:MAG: hypothetical protein C0613_14505 [Desulfobulbaceae bacterium]